MKIGTSILIGSLLLLLSAQRSPAPISESLSKQDAARFAGTWTGRIKFGNAGDVQLTLIINPQATSLIHKSERFGETAIVKVKPLTGEPIFS